MILAKSKLVCLRKGKSKMTEFFANAGILKYNYSRNLKDSMH